MIEKAIEVRTKDGIADGFLYQPAAYGKWPGVIHLTDIVGIRPANRQMAERLASKAYVVALPNVFYRTSKPPVLRSAVQNGRRTHYEAYCRAEGSADPMAMQSDATAYVDFLAKQESVRSGPMGVIGFCFTGAMALRTAAERPDRIAAVASFHGSSLFTDDPASPHTVLPKVKHGFISDTLQRTAPCQRKQSRNLRCARAWNGAHESETYSGAHHGWSVPGSPAYNEPQAERAFQKLTELLAATLS